MKFQRASTIWVAMWILILVAAGRAFAAPAANRFDNIERQPSSVSVITEAGSYDLKPAPNGSWMNAQVKINFRSRGREWEIEMAAPEARVKWLQIRWNATQAPGWDYLGDAWERAYGDLEWKPLDPDRVMPWYFLATDGKVTDGYGVMTDPGALCYWTVNDAGITLHADVRCGGRGVELGRRTLKVCAVVCRPGSSGETSFAADRAFCRMMCPDPRLPKEPAYGFNDWYCTYGHDTAQEFLTNAAFVVSLSPKTGDRPFAVVDDGWEWKGENGTSPGLWNQVNPEFSKNLTMPELAEEIRALGARPGLWYRPLVANIGQPMSWRLERDTNYLDPTVPAVRALIRQTMARFRAWGYVMIKNDYSTMDLCGRWGMQMGREVTPDGWAFADRSKTTAEVIRGLYQDMRAGAGNDVLIEGCNTMGHLSAGLFELQRIGDDTSGNDWSRTRKMGVNCLAFRLPQNGTFFAVDADCVGQVSSNSVPWLENSQWLDLLSHSGAPLFLSFPKNTVDPEQEMALHAALMAASHQQPLAEPLDWLTHRTPQQWSLDGKETSFSWRE